MALSLLSLPEDVQRHLLTSYPHSPGTVQTLVRASQTCRVLQRIASALLLRVLPEAVRFASLDARQRQAADAPCMHRWRRLLDRSCTPLPEARRILRLYALRFRHRASDGE